MVDGSDEMQQRKSAPPQTRMFNSAATSFFTTFIISFATFNVRGLGNQERDGYSVSKRELLATDCTRYNVDICAIQETKVTVGSFCQLHSGHRLILFDQVDSRHGGLGFVVSPRIANFVKSWKYVSDRVSFIDLELPTRSGNPLLCRVVNAYGPHMKLVEDDPRLITKFYGDLNEASNVSSNVEIHFLGDFNSKLGRLNSADIEFGFNNSMGSYGMGKRNENGEHLLNFMLEKNLFAANTAFQHPCRHRTTYTGWRKDWSAGRSSKKTLPVYAQIDYLLCRSRLKPILTDARSYGGALTYSDHRMVVMRMQFKDISLCFQKNKFSSKKFNISELVSNREMQHSYRESLNNNLLDTTPPTTPPPSPTEELTFLFDTVKASAEETVGVVRNRSRHQSNDDLVQELAKERQALILQLNNNESRDRTTLRAAINRKKNEIKKRLKTLREAAADELYATIRNTHESRQMFEAVRSVNNSKPTTGIGVHDENGCLIGTDEGKAEVIRAYLEQQFTRDESPLEPFEGDPRPLNRPFTGTEIELATKSLKNGRANGPDGIPNELLKYSTSVVHDTFANIVNRSFETNCYLNPIGQATIAPLQKPKKPVGPLKNLRPLTLSNAARKIISMATLKRIEAKVEKFTGPWQCAYKRVRSCADIVWCQRIMVSIVQRKKWDYHRMGIDMSSAFDTIRRITILDLLKEAGCDEDDIRLVRFLLSNTKLRVRVNGHLSAEFESLLGAFQGDCLSGCLFTLVLAGALNELRFTLYIQYSRPNPPINDLGMPMDTEYADDVDFYDENEDNLLAILPIATDVLKSWNLFVNSDKTELSHVFLAKRGDVDDDGNLLVGNEPWRKSVTLGSMLCGKADINRRISLGYASFAKYQKTWSTKIPLKKRLMLYDALVVSVMMYNSNSWAVPNSVLDKLDIVHRRHLRLILNYKYPNIISNENLYKRCNVEPLSARVARSRWRMLGHVLRGPEDGPAFSSMKFAVNTLDLPGRRGRPQSNLFSLIQRDLVKNNLNIHNSDDLFALRTIAQNRAKWRSGNL